MKTQLFYTRSGCQCLACGIFKSWAAFDRLEASVTGYSFTCRECKPSSWYRKADRESEVRINTNAA